MIKELMFIKYITATQIELCLRFLRYQQLRYVKLIDLFGNIDFICLEILRDLNLN